MAIWQKVRLVATIVALLVTGIVVANSHGLLAKLIWQNAAAISLWYGLPSTRLPLVILLQLTVALMGAWTVWRLATLLHRCVQTIEKNQ